jgi:selenocysteine lyase/cysteine desulfurase
MAAEALRQLLDWGVGNTYETIGALTDLIERAAEERGIATIPTDRRARHLIGLMLGSDAPDDLATRLMHHGVYVSVRGPSVRVSPHLYNTEKDIERFFDALGEITT